MRLELFNDFFLKVFVISGKRIFVCIEEQRCTTLIWLWTKIGHVLLFVDTGSLFPKLVTCGITTDSWLKYSFTKVTFLLTFIIAVQDRILMI